MKKVKELGAIPDFIQSVNTDESGRFCVAVFHQLHCLVRHYYSILREIRLELTDIFH